MFRLLVIAALIAPSLGAVNFTFESCANKTTSQIRVENVYLAKHPLHFPGNETGSVDVILLQKISGLHYELRVHLQKKIFFGFVDVPCIADVGSCTYNLCDILSGSAFPNQPNNCPAEIVSSSPNFPCSCPFEPGTYHLNATTFFIPEPSGVWKWAAQGDYRAKLSIVDTQNNNEIGCFIVYGTTESDCTGISCIVG